MSFESNRSAAPKPNSASHIPILDGLRGIAALWVLVAHCMIWGGWYYDAIPSPKLAVDVFMVLSGYLMLYQWQSKDHSITLQSAVQFYVRRFFRIAPLYYLILLFTYVCQDSFLHGYAILRSCNPEKWAGDVTYDPTRMHINAKNMLMHLSFLFGLHPRYSFSTFLPDWSLSLEMQFYFLFPLLMLFWRKLGPLVTVAACLLICETISRSLPFFPEPSPLSVKLSVFIVGMLAAEAIRCFSITPRRGVMLLLVALSIAPPEKRILAAVTSLMFLVGISDKSSQFRILVESVLGNKAAKFLAETSYAVYLVHGFLISMVGGWLFQQPAFQHLAPRNRVFILIAVTVAGSYFMGWILYQYVERVGIKIGKLFDSSSPILGRVSTGNSNVKELAGDEKRAA